MSFQMDGEKILGPQLAQLLNSDASQRSSINHQSTVKIKQEVRDDVTGQLEGAAKAASNVDVVFDATRNDVKPKRNDLQTKNGAEATNEPAKGARSMDVLFEMTCNEVKPVDNNLQTGNGIQLSTAAPEATSILKSLLVFPFKKEKFTTLMSTIDPYIDLNQGAHSLKRPLPESNIDLESEENVSSDSKVSESSTDPSKKCQIPTQASSGSDSDYIPYPCHRAPPRYGQKTQKEPKVKETKPKIPKKRGRKSKVTEVTESTDSMLTDEIETTEPCAVGSRLQERCLWGGIRDPPKFSVFRKLKKRQQDVLEVRTGLTLEADSTLCPHHHKSFLGKDYELRQTQCCDPLRKHRHSKKTDLYTITYKRMKSILTDYGLLVVCGQKLCAACNYLLNQPKTKCEDENNDDCDNLSMDEESQNMKVEDGAGRDETEEQEILNTPCTVGTGIGRPCRRTKSKKQFIAISTLSERHQELLKIRTGLTLDKDSNICDFHRKRLLTALYTIFQKKCCNPFGTHKSTIRARLEPITYEFMNTSFRKYGIKLICGQKLCLSCRMIFKGSCLTKEDTKDEEDFCSDYVTSDDSKKNGEKLKLEACTIGTKLAEDCFQISSKTSPDRISFDVLDPMQKEVLALRTGLTLENEGSICTYHKCKFLTKRYNRCQTACSDPLRKHDNRQIKLCLASITYNRMKEIFEEHGVQVVCGQKLCFKCSNALGRKKNEPKEEQEFKLEYFSSDYSSSDHAEDKDDYEPCTLGYMMVNECPRMSSKQKDVITYSQLSEEDKELLTTRTGYTLEPNSTLCRHHKNYILGRRFYRNETKCCDPFGEHLGGEAVALKDLHVISQERAKDTLKHHSVTLVCGKKLCSKCLKKLKIPGIDPVSDDDTK